MHLLLITNLFPPQELGGYGRSMADFAWGLEERGHRITVLCSDAPYLPEPASDLTLRAQVDRRLNLKGDFQNGVRHLTDANARQKVDKKNQEILHFLFQNNHFDGVLLGNLDLLGPEILLGLRNSAIPILHHIGYVSPPFGPGRHPNINNYRMVAASKAVRDALMRQLQPVSYSIPVVYPGARCDLFNRHEARSLPAPLGPELIGQHQLGSSRCPLRVCFAGLLMSTKVHTLSQKHYC